MKNPLVGIIMGSDSDLPVMKDAVKVLEGLGVSSDVRIISAHRTPQALVTYVTEASESGVKVFIAGAGMAAALPGAVAAHTSAPVIGVPLSSSSSAAGGMDAILSIVQMPPGVPVATVGLNSAKNAGLLAAQILALGDAEVAAKVHAYKEKLGVDALAKDKKVQEKGYTKYLEEQGA